MIEGVELSRLSVPAQGHYARAVRMTAANLAALVGFDIERVDDVRMAAQEGFVYALKSGAQERVDIEFKIDAQGLSMVFPLGEHDVSVDDGAEGDSEANFGVYILLALCDDYELGERELNLRLNKQVTGGVDGGRA